MEDPDLAFAAVEDPDLVTPGDGYATVAEAGEGGGRRRGRHGATETRDYSRLRAARPPPPHQPSPIPREPIATKSPSLSCGRAKKASSGTFDGMGLRPGTLKAVRRAGWRLPTPVQRRAIPPLLQGLDVVAMARTGSGKTAAFVVPLIDRLDKHATTHGARSLLLSPTRELALQTHRVVKDLCKWSDCDLRCAALVGGDALDGQFAQLASNPDVLVATPGRLLHLLLQKTSYKLLELFP